MISDEMIDAFNRAYSAVWEVSAPVTTQGEVVTVERSALRAGLEAALFGAHLTADELDALRTAAAKYRAIDTKVPALNSALDKLAAAEASRD